MERKTLAVAWKADATGSLVGYASTFGNVDLGGDVVVPGAFTETVSDLKANGGIPLLADHDPSTGSVLGTIFDAAEDLQGLRIHARFASTQRARDVRQLLVEGHLSKLSIGYQATDYSHAERDGRQVRLLHKVRLWETSVVVFPMNPAAVVTGAKSKAGTPLLLDLDLRLAEEETAVAALLSG